MEDNYMKHRLYLLGMALMVLVAASLNAQAQPFAIPLTVTNDVLVAQPMAFGILAGANPCVDSTDQYLTYREFQRPPVPDPNWQIFSARFVGNPNLPLSECFDQGTLVDFRPAVAAGQKDTFYVQVQDGPTSYPVTVSWPSGLSAYATDLRLVDPFTYGGGWNTDMLTTTSFSITSLGQEIVAIIMTPIIAPPTGGMFFSLTPDGLFDENPLKLATSKKPIKRFKGLGMPNVGNLLTELVAQGGFRPGTTETDSGGGLVMGISSIYEKDPIKHKWAPVKADAALRSWMRMSAWDGVKNIGKSYNAIQKPLKDKTGKHIGIPRGFDSTGVPGALKRKLMVKEQKGLFPKKTSNLLFAELLALKVNIAASALGKTPAGFGELIYDDAGHPFDEWPVKRISEHVDSMMTFWAPYGYADYQAADSAITKINRAFVQPIDTVVWETGGKDVAVLEIKGNVNIATVPYLRLPSPFVPTVVAPANNLTEAPEDWEDYDAEDVDGVPVAMSVMQNFPNPFNPTTTLAFRLAEDASVTVTVFDMLGREVGTLVDREDFDAGVQTLDFDASGLASGIYFYRVSAQNLETGAQIAPVVGKMMMLK
jgi:hypothetical protein